MQESSAIQLHVKLKVKVETTTEGCESRPPENEVVPMNRLPGRML